MERKIILHQLTEQILKSVSRSLSPQNGFSNAHVNYTIPNINCDRAWMHIIHDDEQQLEIHVLAHESYYDEIYFRSDDEWIINESESEKTLRIILSKRNILTPKKQGGTGNLIFGGKLTVLDAAGKVSNTSHEQALHKTYSITLEQLGGFYYRDDCHLDISQSIGEFLLNYPHVVIFI